jgi:hypothetical protein
VDLMAVVAGMALAIAVGMQLRSPLSVVLMALLPAGALAPGCSSGQLASKGQLITCTTDPGTDVILRCESGGDDDGAGECQDIDEDGDGEPHDSGHDGDGDDDDASVDDIGRHHGGASGDSDGDGITDDHDCDEHPGEDADEDGLPYDVRPQLGAMTRPIVDAFAARGAQPAEIMSITLTGSSWRIAELRAGTAFVVTRDDCDHAGNRDVGRDRVVVTWKNADQSQQSDHLDIRYCK